YAAEVHVEQDGTLRVAETLKTAGTSGAIERRLVTRAHLLDDVDHVVEVAEVKAKVGGATVPTVTTVAGDVTTITVQGKDKTGDVTLTYEVRGAVWQTEAGTELRWTPLYGPAAVKAATIALSSPQPLYVRCNAGELNVDSPCTLAQIAEAEPLFEQRDLAATDAMTIIVGFAEGDVAPNTIVEYRKSLRRAFLADPVHLGVTALVLLAGAAALLLLYLKRGKDPIQEGRVVPASLFTRAPDGSVSFTPPDGLRPGEIGTLVDERVDPVDVTSTIIDLAVRGHLHITELARSEFAKTDWILRRTVGRDELRTYEERLLQGIFGSEEEGRVEEEVRVSELGERVRGRLHLIQDALYDEAVSNGWFAERPDRSRSKWTTIGFALTAGGVALTLVLAVLSTWGLLGLAVTGIGIALSVLGQHMPAKTPAAGKVIGQIASLRGELLEYDIAQQAASVPTEAHIDLCSRALPYAIVLGGMERWSDALVATDTDDDPDEGFAWYRGPENWHLHHLPDSLKNFTVGLTGALFAR
ncbi:MAG TPA: DUF2207 domain-containing protein, partial [Actinopolymorphaceae bacterium]